MSNVNDICTWNTLELLCHPFAPTLHPFLCQRAKGLPRLMVKSSRASHHKVIAFYTYRLGTRGLRSSQTQDLISRSIDIYIEYRIIISKKKEKREQLKIRREIKRADFEFNSEERKDRDGGRWLIVELQENLSLPNSRLTIYIEIAIVPLRRAIQPKWKEGKKEGRD